MTDPRTLTPRFPAPELLIGGKSVPAVEGGRLRVHNPATGELLLEVSAAGTRDVDAAVQAARAAFDVGPWPRMNASARGRLVRKLSEALWERREEFALVESLNNGKTFKEALAGDVAPGAATLAYAAEWANKVLGEVAPVDGPFLTYVLRQPVGVVAAIVPWNYPTSLACWKLGPALAVGCTVVLKPSEWTPLTALKLGELAREVGFPDGVLNVLPGEENPPAKPWPGTGGGQGGLHRLRPHRQETSPCLGGHQPQAAVPRARRQEPTNCVGRCRLRGRPRGLLLGNFRKQGRGVQCRQPPAGADRGL